MNIALLWLLLIPIGLAVLMFVVLVLHKLDIRETLAGTAVAFLVGVMFIGGGYWIGKGTKTGDVEILNGQITAKRRIQDDYEEAYSCNCRQTKHGSSCDTCYETHYTVTWNAYSTIGKFLIKHLDSTSRLVYDSPDPRFFSSIYQGEACSRQHDYTNYIKAVPQSLFRPAAKQLRDQYAKMIPPYPINVYDYWHVDRVLPVGVQVPDLAAWNQKLSDVLKTLGPLKQVNGVIVIVNSADPNYAYALQDAWLNGKKNDVVMVIGATHFPQHADWVKILDLTDNQMFNVKLHDDLMSLPQLTSDAVINAFASDTLKYFKRKQMHDFQYLDAEVSPPAWIIWISILLTLMAYGGIWYGLVHADMGRHVRRYNVRTRRFNRFNRF